MSFLIKGMKVIVDHPQLKGTFKFVKAVPEGIVIRVKPRQYVCIGHGYYEYIKKGA